MVSLHPPSANPETANHFFISVELTPPGKKAIKCLALFDSGSQTSLVSEAFVKIHRLPRLLLNKPIRINSIDKTPLANGAITHSISVCLSVGRHEEVRAFGIIPMRLDLIIGADWIEAHKPVASFDSQSLTLQCCNLSSAEKLYFERTSFATNPSSTFSNTVTQETASPNILSAHVDIYSDTAPSAEVASANPLLVIPPVRNITEPLPVHKTPQERLDGLANRDSAPFPALESKGLAACAFSSPQAVKILKYKTFSTLDDVVCVGAIRLSLGNSIAVGGTFSEEPDELLEEIRSALPPKYHEYLDVFTVKEIQDLPPHRLGHDIKIVTEPGKMPPFGPIYSLTEKERLLLQTYLEENLARGYIRPSSSPAGSPILFAKKADGSMRLCVDYRGLNTITVKNCYPLPLVNDLLAHICGCKVFTKIDLKSAFNLLRVAEGDKWKTAFRTNQGLYEYLVMPFGLTNAPAAWQKFIQWVLRGQLSVSCIVYLDDILIFSKDQFNHNIDVRHVLEKLREYRLYASIRKCEFDKQELEYLGYILGVNGLRMNPSKLETISKWPLPTSKTQVRSFLGFCNFYRRFISHYAHLARELNILTHDSNPKKFDLKNHPPALKAFQDLQMAFTTGPVLIHHDPTKETFVFTDASKIAISAIPHQYGDDDLLHPLAYYSRQLSPTEARYDVHDGEMLGVMEGLREFRHWLSGTLLPVAVISDHKNLEYFMVKRKLNSRQARWSMELAEFNFKLSYAPGTKNPADAPSRRFDYETTANQELEYSNMLTLLDDKICSRLNTPAVAVCAISSGAEAIRPFVYLSSSPSDVLSGLSAALEKDDTWKDQIDKPASPFKVLDNLILFEDRVYIPPSLRPTVLRERHDSVLTGHPGAAKTIDLIKRDYAWPGMHRDIRRYVLSCDSCQRVKTARHKPYGPLQIMDLPTKPWQGITMDFIVKLPVSHGFDSIMVVVDRFTKMAHFSPCLEATDAPGLARMFIRDIVRLHGTPESIISDRGSTFVSSFWGGLNSLLGTKLKFSTAYHPQTDGQTE